MRWATSLRIGHTKSGKAFTLIELMVVIAIIAIVVTMLLPVLSKSKERAKRAVCRSNLRQMIVAVQLYGSDHREQLPEGKCDTGVSYTPVVSSVTYTNLVAYCANKTIIGCPGLPKPFVRGGYVMDGYGYVIGFNYLGGHETDNWAIATNLWWQSPRRLSDSGSLVLMTDLNVWSPTDKRSVAPHGPNGPIQFSDDATNPNLEGMPPRALGAVGGNVGILGGSVTWKKMDDMKDYELSSEPGQVFGNW